ncbi:MAG TPA: hypothetical protein VKU87_08530 [Thermomicrobiaceae bacterium]|nr:hypothetical protein [Thermomicrobiaceae bacterium]
MPKFADSVSREQQLLLSVQFTSPGQLAQIFSAFVGQFYDRRAFDTLARQVCDCYDRDDQERARTFRVHLDRRLSDRYHDPVVWELADTAEERAA